MKKHAGRGLALVLCAGLGVSMLTGCGKKAEAAATIFTYNGEAVDNAAATFLFRYQEAEFDEMYGGMLQQYYGATNVWDMDLTGQGGVYGDTFRDSFKETLEKILVAQDHAADYDIKLTDEEEKKISDAAGKFLSANRADVLEAMSATQDSVVKALEWQTIQKKVENEVAKTADTEVSEEEAAQRKVSYICYTPTTETEPESEGLSGADTEAAAENTAGASETESSVTPVASEPETAVETEKSEKTGSADNGSEKAAAGSAEKAGTEAASESADRAAAETETESETETEDPAMQAARAKYRAMAESELAEIKKSDKTFAEISEEISSENQTGVTASDMTFGKDDSYPDSKLIKATNDLDDDTLVDHVVEANGDYYILHVDEKLDKDATESRKEQIIEERKQTAIDDQYTEWEKDVTFTTDDDAFAKLAFDRSYTAPETTATEAQAATEAGGTEAGPAETETGGTEADEAGTQAVTGTEAGEAGARTVSGTETAGK